VTNVFFHIGLYKTATTWFQRQLFPSLDGVQVVRTKFMDKIAPHLNASPASVNGPETLIISHESLSGSISHRRPPGTARARLVDNLGLIANLAPQRSIIVGFREHRAWLQSAYFQRAKKNFRVDQADYVKVFSLDDLSWCRTLETIEASCPSVFPFLYEELVQSPEVLINDLCRFIGKAPPANLDELLHVQENPTPRSKAGQLASTAMLKLARHSGRKRLKPHAYRLGVWLDGYFPRRPFALESDLAQVLRQDWNELLDRIGERRGHDFSSLRKT
jgi:hypothetical protein